KIKGEYDPDNMFHLNANIRPTSYRFNKDLGKCPMSTEENKMLVRRQFDEIWNGGNWATADELYALNYGNHDLYNPDQGTGPEGFKQRVSGYRSVVHDFDLRVERQIAEGDMVLRVEPSGASATPGSRAPFVGRQPMLIRLRLMLEQARAGQPRLVLIEGP